MTRTWLPCRVCGTRHKNPLSSSICSPCGQEEREARLAEERTEQAAYENSPFGQFMDISEEDRWRSIFDRLGALEASHGQ